MTTKRKQKAHDVEPHSKTTGKSDHAARTVSAAASLILRAIILSARTAGVMRRNVFKAASQHGDKNLQELVMLHAKVAELESRVAILRALLGDRECRPHTTLRQRLAIICHMELFDVPKRRITEYFAIARSTFDRWRRDGLGKITTRKEPANKTPLHLAAFVWDMFSKNSWWGKVRQSQQLALLGIFLSPSTVRNILRRPKPTGGSGKQRDQGEPTRSTLKAGIEAKHPNHVWSADLTTFRIWSL